MTADDSSLPQDRLSAPPAYALIGWPLGHSLSPGLHAAAFAAAGIPGRYELLPTPPEGLAEAVDRLRAGELAGANVTVPHKVPIRDLLDAESDLVAAVGAVNTVTRTPDGLRGENTDAVGFRHSLAALLGADRTPGPAVVLGAGGAARAAVYALAEEGFAVEVLARRPSRAAVVVASLHRSLPRAALSSGAMEAGRIAEAARSAMLLVNATPVGASESPGILWPPSAPYPAACALIDLVAWPTESRLVTTARSAGAPAMGGLEMLIAQAAASWSLWTGLPAPEAAMRAAAQQGSMPCHFVS